ncbi:MAG: GxxExxY protein [Saprospiraceae bacterium]
MEQSLLYKEEAFTIIGKCMEVHRVLGHGFLEIVYKDAVEIEFKNTGIPYAREEKFNVYYKNAILRHNYFADFTVYNKIILEVKSMDGLHEDLIARTLNYLKASGYHLGLLVNFGKRSLEYKRIVF